MDEDGDSAPIQAANAKTCPYAWIKSARGYFCFRASGRGPAYTPITGVRFLSAYIQARTQYDIYAYGHTNPTIVTSPWRVSAASHGNPSIYRFTRVVYGLNVVIRCDV